MVKNYWAKVNFEAIIRCDEGHYRYVRDNIELAFEDTENQSARTISMIVDAHKKDLIKHELKRDWGEFVLVSLEIMNTEIDIVT